MPSFPIHCALAFSLFFSAAAARAQSTPADWKLPEAEGQKWARRLKKLCEPYAWTVTAKGNDIILQRDRPVTVSQHIHLRRSLVQ